MNRAIVPDAKSSSGELLTLRTATIADDAGKGSGHRPREISRRQVLGFLTAVAFCPPSGAFVSPPGDGEGPVVELRQYTCLRGKRDELISLFESVFVAAQEDHGIRVLGAFTDLDDPDRFVWMRGFKDMSERLTALNQFYSDEVWQIHKHAVNATIVDADNVLLLRPAYADLDVFGASPVPRLGAYGAAIYYGEPAQMGEFVKFFREAMLPRLQTAGVLPFAMFVTEPAPNNYPRLNIRQHESVFVWVAGWHDMAGLNHSVARMRADSGWRDSASPTVLSVVMKQPEILRLSPASKTVRASRP